MPGHSRKSRRSITARTTTSRATSSIRRGTSRAASTTCACSRSLAGESRINPTCRSTTREISLLKSESKGISVPRAGAIDYVTVEEIRAARERIRPAARYTPLIEVDGLWLKAESLQPMGAFKIRGAYNMVAQLPKEQLQ